MPNDPTILDLDELLGLNRELAVIWGGERYRLKPPGALGPDDLAALRRVAARGRELGALLEGAAAAGQPPPPGVAAELEGLLGCWLERLCPELALAALPPAARARVVRFYAEQAGAPAGGPPAPKASAR